jgi:hypothetical protein
MREEFPMETALPGTLRTGAKEDAAHDAAILLLLMLDFDVVHAETDRPSRKTYTGSGIM